jgi:hypothetical protein
MQDPNPVGTEADVEVIDESPSSSTDDLKDEKIDKVAGIDDDEEEFDLVSASMHSLVPGASLKD